MSRGFDMLRDYIEHDCLAMRRGKCCEIEHELLQEFEALEAENEKLRGLATQLYDYVDELKALAQRLYYCGQSDRECDRCGMNGADIHVKMNDVDYCDGINMCVRELGIEVD